MTITPATLTDALKAAKPGDVLTLEGDFGHVFLRKMAWDAPGVVLDCSAARFESLRLQTVAGLTILDATDAPDSYLGGIYIERQSDRITIQGVCTQDAGLYGGVIAHDSTNINILGCTFDCPKVGVSFSRVTGALIQGSTFYGYSVDGIDLAGCHDITVELNSFSGGKLLDDHHPDAVQGWPIRGEKPPSNNIIRDNEIHGQTQGIGFYDHDAGGYDNITIERNTIVCGYPGAITLRGSRNSFVRDNTVKTLPGSAHKASINTDAARSGNTVAAFMKWPSDDDAG